MLKQLNQSIFLFINGLKCHPFVLVSGRFLEKGYFYFELICLIGEGINSWLIIEQIMHIQGCNELFMLLCLFSISLINLTSVPLLISRMMLPHFENVLLLFGLWFAFFFIIWEGFLCVCYAACIRMDQILTSG